MKLIAVNHDGIIETHIPGHNGDYATFCGLDGDDPNNAVRQSPDIAGEKVDCPQCIAGWKIARKIKPNQIANDTN